MKKPTSFWINNLTNFIKTINSNKATNSQIVWFDKFEQPFDQMRSVLKSRDWLARMLRLTSKSADCQ